MSRSTITFAVLIASCGIAGGGCGQGSSADPTGPDGGGQGPADAPPTPDEKPGFGTPEVLASGLVTPMALAVDGDTVYWLEGGTGSSDGKLVRRAPDGSKTTLASSLVQPSSLTVLNGELFYTTLGTGKGLQRIAASGGNSTTIASGFIVSLHVFDGKLYASTGNEIRSYTREGVTTSLVTTASVNVVFAIDASGLYWVDDTRLQHAPLTGGAANTLATVAPGYAIAVDATSVYGVSAAELVWKVAKTGGEPTQLAMGGTVEPLASDARHLYYGDCGAGSVVAVGLTAGTRSLVDNGYVCPSAIEVTPSALYVLDGTPYTNTDQNTPGRIVRIPRADAPPRTDETWCYEPVATQVNGRPVIARGHGFPIHVAYTRAGGGLEYLRGEADGTWTNELIDPNTPLYGEPSIAAGADGSVHVAYQVNNHDVWHARRAPGGAWTRERIAGSGIISTVYNATPSLVIDAAGTVHVFYEETSASSDLKHAQRAVGATSWAIESAADSFVGQRGEKPAAVIDATGAIAVLHGGDEVGGPVEARLAQKTVGGAWTDARLLPGRVDGRDSIDADAAGGLHVMFANGGSMQYGYRPSAAAGWTFTPLSSAPCGTSISIGCEATLAASANGDVYATTTLYEPFDTLEVQKRTAASSAWSVMRVSLWTDEFSSLRVDGDAVDVIYHRMTLVDNTRNLRHAYRCRL